MKRYIKQIYLVWRRGRSDRRIKVGRILRNQTEGVRFMYIPENLSQAVEKGFNMYPDFPNPELVYKNNVLEIFSQRLTNTERTDIQKYYDAHKNSFRQTNSRDIEYVLFDVLPSEADYAEAEKTINNIAEEFAASETPFQYAVLNSQEQPDKTYRSEEELPTEMATFAFGKDQPKMYGPVKEGDVYTLARVADVKMIPDSLGARHILIKAGETERTDSILTALKGGASFDELSKLYSLDQAAAANGGDLGIFTADRMVPEFSEAVINTDKGEYFTCDGKLWLATNDMLPCTWLPGSVGAWWEEVTE